MRFYIHFSVPMRPGAAFDHIKLRDAEGNVDDSAFMRFKQELWNADRTRLTVLMDPGRIKRNVATNVELGPALLEGREYTLSVGAGWASADGQSILPAFERRFTVSAPLRELPDVRNWRIASPCVGTREPIAIDFDRPFDRHLLLQDLHFVTNGGLTIGGSISVQDGEQSLRFTPDMPWASSGVRIQASPTLEDVAANNLLDLLDHVASDRPTDKSAVEISVSLSECS